MALKVEATELPGVLVITPDVFGDERGFFMETYSASLYADAGIGDVFVQDNYSHSRRGTLRGLHYQLQRPQAKLISVIWGEIYDVAVDIRRGSPTYGQWVGQTLSEQNRSQLFVPAGFAHGFCVLSERALFSYKCTDFYSAPSEFGIAWDDPDIGIDWPIDSPQLSAKDQHNRRLKDIPTGELPHYE